MNLPVPSSRFDAERYTAWYAVIGVCALAAAPAASGWFLLIAVPALFLACLSDTRRFYLFGPYLESELRTHSRQTRVHLWRFLIALVVAIPVLSFYFAITELPPEQQPARRSVGSIAAGVFLFYFWVLFMITGTTTMQLLSGAIAEDRESKRHDFILATDLRGRELVIGKMLARFLSILAYPAAALPLILMMPLLFHMDPAIILYTFAYSAVTLFSVAGLAALASVLAANKKSGANWAVLFILPYVVLIFLASLLKQQPRIWFFPGSQYQPPWLSVGDVIEWISVGNPLSLFMKWGTVAATGGDLRTVAADLPAYSAFHLFVGGMSFLYAARWIRYASANSGEVKTPTPGTTSDYQKPPIGDAPVLWKDFVCHPFIVKNQQNRTANRLAQLLLIWLPVAICLASIFSDLYGYAIYVKDLSRFYPAIVTWFVMVFSAQLATQAIAREREKDTLIMLATTAMTAEEIFREKFWAIQRIMRGPLLWHLAVGIPTVLCGSFSWWGYLGLLILHIVMQMQLTAWGLMFSADSPNTQVAQRRFGIVSGVVVFCVCLVAGLLFALFSTHWPRYPLIAIFPPVTIMALGFAHNAVPSERLYWILGFLFGMTVHAAVARYFYLTAKRRFLAACDPNSENGPLFDNRSRV